MERKFKVSFYNANKDKKSVFTYNANTAIEAAEKFFNRCVFGRLLVWGSHLKSCDPNYGRDYAFYHVNDTSQDIKSSVVAIVD